jgi:hypothetical protein
LKGLFRHKKTTYLTVLLKNFSAVAIEKLAKFENGKIGSTGSVFQCNLGHTFPCCVLPGLQVPSMARKCDVCSFLLLRKEKKNESEFII